MDNNEKGFIGYEYRDVTVGRELEPLYSDCYPSFGWSLEDSGIPLTNIGSITLKFKRDRKILNKAELTRLQRQFESLSSDVDRLEKSKTIGASAAAYIIGIAATAFMAGSVFAYLGGVLALSIILAVPGFIGWAIAYPMFVRLRNKKTNTVAPLIDKKHDDIYDVCEKASGLLVGQPA